MTARIGKTTRNVAVKCLACLLVVGFSSGPVFWQEGQAWARDRREGNRYIHRLPRGHMRHEYRGQSYYYHGGQYFRHRGRGYELVRPPRGMHLRHLPLGYAAVLIAGITYFTYLGVYYQAAPGGYVVVEPPVGAPPAAPIPSQAYAAVTVIVQDLNVRQGPGLRYAIVGLTSQGETLTVFSQMAGWLYVQTPNGQTGWVDQRYTRPLSSGAAG